MLRLFSKDAGSIGLQILACENTAASPAGNGDGIGHVSGIKSGGALFSDSHERLSELVEAKSIASCALTGRARQTTVGQKQRSEPWHLADGLIVLGQAQEQ